MHPILIRILKQGIPVALILAVIGYLMAEAAGMFFATQGGDSAVRITVGNAPPSEDGGEDLTRALQRRLPFTLAAWGFGLITVFELVRGLLRGHQSATPSGSLPAVPTEDETEKLLNHRAEGSASAPAASVWRTGENR